MARKDRSLTPMAFYHEDGFVSAYKQASRFAGDGGRLATMLDVVRLRLASKPGDESWEQYYTTMTAEYLGFSKAGFPIIIVAHGIGPMSDLRGVLNAYSYEYSDKNRNRRGGRITEEAFQDLESGKFGDVEIVDFADLFKLFKYPFLGQLRASEALRHPLLKARLGHSAEDLILHHARYAREFHEEEGHGHVEDPYITSSDAPGNCPYGWRNREQSNVIEAPMLERDGLPLAHLISTSRLVKLMNPGDQRFPALMNDVGCHEWWNGVRMLAIPAGCNMNTIHRGVNTWSAIRRHWQNLLVPVTDPPASTGFYPLTKVDEGTVFTQYPKTGDGMDTHEPEFLVTKMTRVHGPRTFTTTIGGYHGFFKFDVREVQAIAPQGANAYIMVGEPTFGGDGHISAIEFYHVEIDTTKRLMRRADLANDYELLMKIAELEQAEQV